MYNIIRTDDKKKHHVDCKKNTRQVKDGSALTASLTFNRRLIQKIRRTKPSLISVQNDEKVNYTLWQSAVEKKLKFRRRKKKYYFIYSFICLSLSKWKFRSMRWQLVLVTYFKMKNRTIYLNVLGQSANLELFFNWSNGKVVFLKFVNSIE